VAQAQVPKDGPDPFEELLAELRQAAQAHDYHERAWPIVEALAGLELRAPERIAKRLEAIAAGGEGEVDRVRSGCVVALALRKAPSAQATAERFTALDNHELERAGWVALGLLADGGDGTTIDLRRFENPIDLRTYPAAIGRRSAQRVIDRAIHRVLLPVPAELMEVSLDLDGNLPRLEEQFTRCVVVLTILGPSVGEGPVREELLHWLRGVAPLAALADRAVLHCLALGAAVDEELAAQLLDIAAERLLEPEGTCILEALVRLGEREQLVLDHLRGFFASEDAIEGDPLYLLTQAHAVAALMPLLGSEDPALRDEASALALERLADPSLDPIERQLFLTTLATRRSDLLLDVVQTLVNGTKDEDPLVDALSFLDAVSAEDRSAGQDLLLSLLGREGIGAELRLAIIREIAQVNAAGTTDLLLTLRSMEQDAAVLALLDELIGGG
jgi:hypothetical protein